MSNKPHLPGWGGDRAISPRYPTLAEADDRRRRRRERTIARCYAAACINAVAGLLALAMAWHSEAYFIASLVCLFAATLLTP